MNDLPFDFQYFPICSAVPVGGGGPEDGVVLLDEVGALGRGGRVRGGVAGQVFRSAGVGGGVGAADDGVITAIRSWSCNSDCEVLTCGQIWSKTDIPSCAPPLSYSTLPPSGASTVTAPEPD